MRTRRRIKNLCVNLSVLALSTIVVFFGIEWSIRCLYKDTIALTPRYHTDARYGEFLLRRIKPNFEFQHTGPDGSWMFRTNSQGFRNDVDFDYAKPEGKIRILCLGDSQTQGYEVRQEYTFSAIIERYLTTRGYDAEVMNTGVSGFSTAEELLFLEYSGLLYSPDIVILGFYANDFQDNIKSGLFQVDERNNLQLRKKTHIPGVAIQNVIYELPVVKWLSEHSYFYSILFNNVWTYYKRKLTQTSSENLLEYTTPAQQDLSEYQTALAVALISRMSLICHRKQVKFLVVDILKKTGTPQLETVQTFAPSASPALFTLFQKASDAFIDSSALLAEYIGVAELYNPHGTHISEFSHTIIGVEVAKRIESWLRVPSGENIPPEHVDMGEVASAQGRRVE